MSIFSECKSSMVVMAIVLLIIIAGGVVFYLRSLDFHNSSMADKEKNENPSVTRSRTASSSTQSGNALYGRFVALENELETVRINRMYFSAEHAQRIQDALTKLKDDGYLEVEIQRLRERVLEMSPKMEGEDSVSGVDGFQGDCFSNTNPVFSYDITDVGSVAKITPPGIVTSEGVLKSHSYIWNKGDAPVAVYAPVSMKLTSGAFYTEDGLSQYLLFFSVSCEVQIKLDHILDPVQEIKALFPQVPKFDSRTSLLSQSLFFAAGDLIGYTSGTSPAHNWDFGVYNQAKSLNVYIDDMEELDRFANCPYDYYPLDRKEVYYSLFDFGFVGGAMSVQYCR